MHFSSNNENDKGGVNPAAYAVPIALVGAAVLIVGGIVLFLVLTGRLGSKKPRKSQVAPGGDVEMK